MGRMRTCAWPVWTGRFRFFVWGLLHDTLRCGSSAVAWVEAASREHLADLCACQAAYCSAVPLLDIYSHIFVLCPVVAPAVGWLSGLWASIAAGSPPSLTARVLVAGQLDDGA